LIGLANLPDSWSELKPILKKYYEGKREYTLFEWKGYQIKYDTIRKTKLYQQLTFECRDD
jgi:hypothetical protein